MSLSQGIHLVQQKFSQNFISTFFYVACSWSSMQPKIGWCLVAHCWIYMCSWNNICGSKAVVAAVVKMSTVPTLGIVLNNHITKVKS